MKVAYLCPMAHVTVIFWDDQNIKGKLAQQIQCTKLNCGCASHIFTEWVIDNSVKATHEFYRVPLPTEIVSIEEQKYLDMGFMMFREIKGNQPEENIKEFKATEGMIKLANFLVPLIPIEERKDDVVDTAIDFIKELLSIRDKSINLAMRVLGDEQTAVEKSLMKIVQSEVSKKKASNKKHIN